MAERQFIAAGIFSLPAAEIDIGRFGSFHIGRPVYSNNPMRPTHYRMTELPWEGRRVRLIAVLKAVRGHVLGADPDFNVQARTLEVGAEVALGHGRLQLLPARAGRAPAIGLLPDTASFGPWMDAQACYDLDYQTVRLYAEPAATVDPTTGRIGRE